MAASTIVESVPVTVDEVRRILAGDKTVEVRSEDRELVEGYRGAMNFVMRRADVPSFAWNRELLIGLHDRVLAGKWSEGAGRFRAGTHRVGRGIWTVIEDLVESTGSDRRVANAAWDAFFGRDVTAGYYRSLTGVSPATATKDLGLAVAAGLLKAEGERRGRRYLAGDRLYEEVSRVIGIDIDASHPRGAREFIVAVLGERLTKGSADSSARTFAGMGLQPEVDLDSSAALLESMDEHNIQD